LEIPVHEDDDITAGRFETCRERSGLPEVSAELDDDDFRMLVGQPFQQAEAAVLATVVDVNDLVLTTEGVEHTLELLVKLRDVFDLVIDRNDDGQHQRTPTHGIRRSIRQSRSRETGVRSAGSASLVFPRRAYHAPGAASVRSIRSAPRQRKIRPE
jgi:hypothetical protein